MRKANDEVIKETLKNILLNRSSIYGNFCKWKEITNYVNSILEFHNYKPTTETKLRLELIREIREDKSFTMKNGYPISMNSVGVKLTKDQGEIREYIAAETSRFLKGLKNLTEAKRYLNNLNNEENYSLDFTKKIVETLEKENDLQDGHRSSGEIEFELGDQKLDKHWGGEE